MSTNLSNEELCWGHDINERRSTGPFSSLPLDRNEISDRSKYDIDVLELNHFDLSNNWDDLLDVYFFIPNKLSQLFRSSFLSVGIICLEFVNRFVVEKHAIRNIWLSFQTSISVELICEKSFHMWVSLAIINSSIMLEWWEIFLGDFLLLVRLRRWKEIPIVSIISWKTELRSCETNDNCTSSIYFKQRRRHWGQIDYSDSRDLSFNTTVVRLTSMTARK